MDFLEAKCRAGVNTLTRIFEESHKCKIPREIVEEMIKEQEELFGKLRDCIHGKRDR